MNGNKKKIMESYIKSQQNKARFEKLARGKTAEERLRIYRKIVRDNQAQKDKRFMTCCTLFILMLTGCNIFLMMLGRVL